MTGRVSEAAAVVGAVAAGAIAGLAISRGAWWVVAGLAGVAALPAVVRWPVAVCLGAYALLLPFDSITVITEGPSGPTVTRVIGAVAGAILLVTAVATGRLVRPPAAALWWTLFTIWGAVSTAWALDTDVVLGRVPTAAGLLLLYVVATSVKGSGKQVSAVCALAILGGMAAAAYATYTWGAGGSYGEVTGRASLIVAEREEDPNQFATSLLLPLALAAGGFAGVRHTLVRWGSLVGVLVIGIGLLLTMSRGTLIALAAMGGWYAYRAGVRRTTWIPFLVLGLGIWFMPPLFFERLNLESGVASRLDIWRVGLQAAWKYGLIGAGLSNFPLAFNQFAGYSTVFRGYSRGSHNVWLGTLVELGVVGLGLLAGGIVSHLRRLGRGPDAHHHHWALSAVESACIGVLVSGTFLDILWRKSFWLPWILLVQVANCTASGHREKP